MNDSTQIQCPYCGTYYELPIDTSLEDQAFTTDCENCCRPFEVVVECSSGEIVYLEVSA